MTENTEAQLEIRNPSIFHGYPVMTDTVPRALARDKRPINLPSVDTLLLANTILKL